MPVQAPQQRPEQRPVLGAGAHDPPPAASTPRRTRVEAVELPFWHKPAYGSADWWDSWNRRNLVEGLFGNVKNDASQNLTRGRIRVMGLARVSLMAMFLTMAANLRLSDTWHLRQEREADAQAQAAAGVAPKTRKPRWRTRQLNVTRERIAALQEAREAANVQAGHPPRLRVLPDPPA